MKPTRRSRLKQPATPAPAGGGGIAVPKKSTGIPGLDEVLHGGIPEGRLVAITGGPGVGKTMLALEMLVHRARYFNETGIFICFEESPERIRQNVASMNWSVGNLWETHLALIDGRPVFDMAFSGDFDLGGLVALIDGLRVQTGAKIAVLDGLDMLLMSLRDHSRQRQEFLRISRWTVDSGLCCIISTKATADTSEEAAWKNLVHYNTDCVIELDARIFGTSLARTLRVIKYRGSGFAASAFPAVLSANGFEVFSAPSPRLGYKMFEDRVATGIDGLDALLGGGLRRGTSMLISGAPGTAKTVLAGHITAAACQRGEPVLMISFDQGDSQIIFELKSLGVDLQQWVDQGLLALVSLRSWTRSPEEHLTAIRKLVAERQPKTLVIDPFSALNDPNYPFSDSVSEILIDDSRGRGMTLVLTTLTGGNVGEQEISISNVSTVVDTWIHLSYSVHAGERNRALSIVKSRGTSHSNQSRELIITSDGLYLVAPYIAEGGVLMGSARVQKEAEQAQRAFEAATTESRREFDLKRRLSELEGALEMAKKETALARREIEIFETEALERKGAREKASGDRLAARMIPPVARSTDNGE